MRILPRLDRRLAKRALDAAGVARRAHAEDLELGALVGHVGAELREELLRVLDRVALRELVRLADDLLALVDEDGLR